MSTSDFTLAFILLCKLQGCTSQDCEAYEDSWIKYTGCGKLIIDGGTVCYMDATFEETVAKVTCQEGYDLIGTPTRICRRFSIFAMRLTWDDRITICEREQRSTASQTSEQWSTTSQTPERRSTTSQTSASEQRSTTSPTPVSDKSGSLLAVDITVPTVAIVILVLVVVVVLLYRRRRLAENVRLKNQKDRTSAVTNKTYDDKADARAKSTTSPGRVDNNDSDYYDIPDTVDQNTVGTEYSTLHMDERVYNIPNYNHIPPRSDTNDHITSTVGNVQKMTDTHSHLNNANHDNNSNDWNKETGDVYNKLGADAQCVSAIELDSASKASDYDQTNTCSEKSARIELDTYSQETWL